MPDHLTMEDITEAHGYAYNERDTISRALVAKMLERIGQLMDANSRLLERVENES